MAEVKSIYTIIKSPLITEKATNLRSINQYVFWVDPSANKVEVKNAIEKLYKVKVKGVNILNVKGKTKRVRWREEGKTSLRKKAIVTLKEGYEIKIA